MSGAPLLYPLQEHRSGTSWDGAFRVCFRDAGSTDRWDLTGATARLVWSDAEGTVLGTWTIGAGLEVPDPEDGWLYVVGPGGAISGEGEALVMQGGVMSGDPGPIVGELVFTFASGVVSEPMQIPMMLSAGAAL